jgi:hypothetical protein
VADGWCWFVVREKYCRLVADKPSEQSFGFSLAACSGVSHVKLINLMESPKNTIPYHTFFKIFFNIRTYIFVLL